LPDERRALGWSDGPATLAPAIVAPTDEQIASIVGRSGSSSLHVFSGIRWYRTLTTALRLVRQQGLPFAIMSEPRDDAGLAGILRFVQSWATEGSLRRHVQFVLAIGRHGPPWFYSVGYRRDRVFPFAYFLAQPCVVTFTPCPPDTPLRVLYVGRLIEQKGIRYLLQAVKAIARPAHLTLIGEGELRSDLAAQASELGVKAEFRGVLPIRQVQQLMRQFDVLVLPSIRRTDGWGAVVSEALLVGTAVVVSDCVGASILLDSAYIGRIVPPADSQAIAAAIEDLERTGALTARARRSRIEWAGDRLTARAGATYFEQIVRYRMGAAQRPKEFYL
jgi:glycosyltransferase involved in cell wall biosynthesis